VQFSKSALVLIAICSIGCTSFRTKALYRCDNDSVVPECTNKKLKGIPVKLKVPSHVLVTVSEQQVILAASAEEIQTKKDKATTAAAAVKTAKDAVNTQQAATDAADAALDDAEARLDDLNNQLKHPETPLNDEQKGVLTGKIVDQQAAVDAAKRTKVAAHQDLADAQADVPKKVAAAAAAAAAAAKPEYTLVSLIYTDKVFLVDFKRPAGGILDLKQASMDDEQYFKNVQAEVQERTIQDISTAIATLTPGNSNNKAVPKSANTPADAVSDVNFQKSIVACQRFDISEPDWEFRLSEFVNTSLGRTDLNVCPSSIPPIPLTGKSSKKASMASVALSE
jgi:hypothetical protein